MTSTVYNLEPVSDCEDGLAIYASRSVSLSPEGPQVLVVVVNPLDKGTQVGSSFGKVDLPYEPGGKIFIPSIGSKISPSTSIEPSLPLEARVRLDDVRKVHVADPSAGSMIDISITFPNNNKRSRPC